MKKITSIQCIIILLFIASLYVAAISKETQPLAIDYDKEQTQILQLIDTESKAFWDKDYNKWAACWVHAPYIRTMGWWKDGGVTVVKGWDERDSRTKGYMKDFPKPNPQNVRRENINVRIFKDAAWVTFDQYGTDTGEPLLDMPGLSRETRFLEKHNGQWKIAYAGWLLEGKKQ
ncbi:nuclear transport factor 2 family protein [Dyadobacter sp. CY343]|uniref:nuclear transport factor 2 family protein n=1 Tax=Dyadobacter sp. CY343 TaxID=2907299 RepID=UPI001F25D1C8|nr:nuclear transport factor 2 family protein [Dyadobacter sp. CY343]MCE7062367.1 nuclear transport factor 2 family protein [Dyadobacter sp. CY343]